MRIFIALLILFLYSKPTFSMSMTGVNPAAVNMSRYYQQRNIYSNKRYMRNQTPYVYSEQQAKYYGLRTTPNSTYQYNQTYRNYNNQRYGY